MKRLYARLVLWLIRPALEKALEPEGLIWAEFERGGPGGTAIPNRVVLANIPSRHATDTKSLSREIRSEVLCSIRDAMSASTSNPPQGR